MLMIGANHDRTNKIHGAGVCVREGIRWRFIMTKHRTEGDYSDLTDCHVDLLYLIKEYGTLAYSELTRMS